MQAKSKKDRTWNKWSKKRRPDLCENYTDARNYHARLCREVKRSYEKDVVEKCLDKPKLFYQFVSSKLKNKERISSA